eukprot:g18920.t1
MQMQFTCSVAFAIRRHFTLCARVAHVAPMDPGEPGLERPTSPSSAPSSTHSGDSGERRVSGSVGDASSPVSSRRGVSDRNLVRPDRSMPRPTTPSRSKCFCSTVYAPP